MALTTYEIRAVGRVPAELVPALGDVRGMGQELRTLLTGSFVTRPNCTDS
jgi:hypothetical protein